MDPIDREMAIDAAQRIKGLATLPDNDTVVRMSDVEYMLLHLPSVQSDDRLAKIADLVEGTIDHFDLDDAMDLLYQIKEIVGNETSNIRG